MSPWVFLLLALAAYRVTRFLVLDSLLEGPRRWMFRRFPPGDPWLRTFFGEHHRTTPSKLGQLLDCPYCLGFWVSGCVLAVAVLSGLTDDLGVIEVLLAWWALSGAQALLNAADAALSR